MKKIPYLQIIKFLKKLGKKIFKRRIKDICILEGGGGRNNINVFLRVYFINGEKNIIFRYCLHSSDQQKKVYEYQKLKFLNGHPSPKPLYLSQKSQNYFKKNILILEYLEGLAIKPRFFSREESQLAAKTLAKLHQANFKEFSLDLEFPPEGRGDLRTLLLRKILDLKIFFKESKIEHRDKILKIFRLTEKNILKKINVIKEKNFSFLHGDLRNHFVKKDNKFYLIDWETSRVGDVAEDLAHFLYFSKTTEFFKKEFIGHYLKYRPQDKGLLARTKIYIILEEFFGLKWTWQQSKLRKDKDEKYYYHHLYEIRYKNIIKAFRFFPQENYYLKAGHLSFYD